MKKIVLNIQTILGQDIRVRSRIFELNKYMDSEATYVLDFTNVTFISRSFADELVTMTEMASNNIEITGAKGDVGAMLEIVKKGRQTMHKGTTHSQTIHLENMDDVASFFAY